MVTFVEMLFKRNEELKMSESKATEGHPDGQRGPVARAESDVHSCSEAVTGIGAVKQTSSGRL